MIARLPEGPPAAGEPGLPPTVRRALLFWTAALPVLEVQLPLGPKSVVLGDLAFVVLLVQAVRHREAAMVAPRPSLVTTAAALVAATAVSASVNGNGAFDVARVAYAMAVLLLVAHLRLGREDARAVAGVWLATGVAVCAVGMAAYAADRAGVRLALAGRLQGGWPRLSSTLPANALTLYVQCAAGVGTVVALSGVAAARRWRLAGALFVVASTLAVSRGLAGLLLVLAAGESSLDRRRARGLALVAGAAILAVAAVSVWAVVPVRILAEPPYLSVNTGPSAYRLLNEAAFRMAADHPLTGVGPDGYGAHFARYVTPERRHGAWPVVRASVVAPHSVWQGSAARLGLIGLGALLAVAAAVARECARAGADDDLRRGSGLALGALAFSGLHMDWLYLKFVWACAGLAVAGGLPRAAPSRQAGAGGPQPSSTEASTKRSNSSRKASDRRSFIWSR